jgi:hypothetical protein
MKINIAILFLALPLFVLSQTDYGIKKIRGFYEEHMPGNIPVGEDGRPLHKYPIVTHRIYVETTPKTNIKWTNAWKNGKTFSISTTQITQLPFEVGKKKSNQEKIEMKVSKGNKLWQLELNEAETQVKCPLKANSTEIILQGIYKGKKIYKRIASETELYVIPSV